MDPFVTLTGPAAPLILANVDTDVIIRIERLTAEDQSQLGRYAFESLRYRPDGSEDPGFVLNQPPFRNAPILIGGPNFGCGSSREGAVIAIKMLGIRCVIAESFGDIFFGNCFQNGLLPIRLPESEVLALADRAKAGAPLTVDLRDQTVTFANQKLGFEVDPRRKQSLLEGLDDIGLTLKQMDDIRAWQAKDKLNRKWAWAPVERVEPALSIEPPNGVQRHEV
jgi:3-isopropylmalate/(R)-2-methylmalate dehydratase small subunit